MRLSESVASSIGSNLHRLGTNPQGALEFPKIILTDDYFSDVNPRSMRRLMNVIYITVRLLKAFQIDFSWYRLSSWINLTEQWPLRASMIVLQHDQSGENLDDSFSLQSVYEKVRPKIACLREAAPLLDLDRDERKLDAFLQLHKSDLLVTDLRMFLPFTINLDPYLRKVLKEDQQAFEDEGAIVIQSKPSMPPPIRIQQSPYIQQYPPIQYPIFSSDNLYNCNLMNGTTDLRQRNTNLIEASNMKRQLESSFPEEILQLNLSELTVDGVINLVKSIEDLKPVLAKIAPILNDNSINGRVLKHCDLNELKPILGLTFGHWELFRLLITTLRDCEHTQKKVKITSIAADNGINDIPDSQALHATPALLPPHSRKNSTHMMEKQVTLEEQMICGALQTLNEEAFEDVASSERPSPTGLPTDNNTGNLSSPLPTRRDSILKQTGSIKSDKRVSIKNENNIMPHLEIVCEKPEKRNKTCASGPRPASLVITKNEKPQFKLVRSSSVDYDDVDGQAPKSNEQGEDENSPLVLNVNKS